MIEVYGLACSTHQKLVEQGVYAQLKGNKLAKLQLAQPPEKSTAVNIRADRLMDILPHVLLVCEIFA